MHADIEKLFDLKNKVALITGGAVHLGRDAANVLAAAGCDVIITSRDRERAQLAAQEIKRTYGGETVALPLDQSEPSQGASAATAAQSWRGRIDILVNNAGGGSNRGAAH